MIPDIGNTMDIKDTIQWRPITTGRMSMGIMRDRCPHLIRRVYTSVLIHTGEWNTMMIAEIEEKGVIKVDGEGDRGREVRRA
jgi:hypothetical protein